MPQRSDLAIVNANVRTVDSKDSTAQAVLIRNGSITVVGTDAEVRAAATADAQELDLNGQTVVPGFIDAHNHLSVAAFAPLAAGCWTPPLTTLTEVLEQIRRSSAKAVPGQWVMGLGFHASKIQEQRNPSRQELDEVSPDNPCLLIDASCHAGYANSLALQRVGISAHSPQPWGGAIDKDGAGEPTGTLYEAAINLVHSAAWDAHAFADWDRSTALLEARMREYLAVGITAVGDACVTTHGAELYRRANEAGRLPMTVQQLHGGDHFFTTPNLDQSAVVERLLEPGGERLRGGVMKLFADRFYPDGPAIDELHDGCTRHIGTPFYSKDEIHELATKASELGIGTAIHATGNCAVDFVLDAYEAVRRASPTHSILRVEHAFIAEPRQGVRLAELDVDLVVNPGLAHNWGEVFDGCRQPGQEHLKVLPVRSMLDAGVRVSLASDHPCGTFSPAAIMGTAVGRTTLDGTPIDPDEAVTPMQALRMHTANAAHASGRAAEEGTIEVGKRGNLAVLDRDVAHASADDLHKLQVTMTVVDGVIAHGGTAG